MLSGEIERLNGTLRLKIDEYENMRKAYDQRIVNLEK